MKNNKDRPQIKVAVTKTREFRATIKERKGEASYEVTIGGEQWNKGKGREYEDVIKRKCQILLETMTEKLETIFGSEKNEKYIDLGVKVSKEFELNSDDAARELSNIVYSATVYFYENIGEHGKLTDGKRLRGNGHHMAQELSQKAKDLWYERLIDKKE